MEQYEIVILETRVLKDVTCDKCGVSCMKEKNIESARITANWGYDSGKDGECHVGYLCENCYDWLIQVGFRPEVTELAGIVG